MLSTGTRHPVRTAPGLRSPAALGGRVPQSHPGLQERLWECFPFGQRGRELHGREAFLSESQGGVRRGTAVPAPEGWAGSAPRVGGGTGLLVGLCKGTSCGTQGGSRAWRGLLPAQLPAGALPKLGDELRARGAPAPRRTPRRNLPSLCLLSRPNTRSSSVGSRGFGGTAEPTLTLPARRGRQADTQTHTAFHTQLDFSVLRYSLGRVVSSSCSNPVGSVLHHLPCRISCGRRPR